MLTAPSSRTPVPRAHGTKNFANWSMAEQVTDLNTLNPGDILFADNSRFDALNLSRITRINPERGNAYARLVSPSNTKFGRLGYGEEDEFCIWDFELVAGLASAQYFRAARTEISASEELAIA